MPMKINTRAPAADGNSSVSIESNAVANAATELPPLRVMKPASELLISGSPVPQDPAVVEFPNAIRESSPKKLDMTT